MAEADPKNGNLAQKLFDVCDDVAQRGGVARSVREKDGGGISRNNRLGALGGGDDFQINDLQIRMAAAIPQRDSLPWMEQLP